MKTYDVPHQSPSPSQLPQQAGSTTAPSDPPNTLGPVGSSDNNSDKNNNYSDSNNDKNNNYSDNNNDKNNNYSDYNNDNNNNYENNIAPSPLQKRGAPSRYYYIKAKTKSDGLSSYI